MTEQEELEKLREFALAHEVWEAQLITDGDWTGELPKFTQSIYDGFMKLQGLRNQALKREG